MIRKPCLRLLYWRREMALQPSDPGLGEVWPRRYPARVSSSPQGCRPNGPVRSHDAGTTDPPLGRERPSAALVLPGRLGAEQVADEVVPAAAHHVELVAETVAPAREEQEVEVRVRGDVRIRQPHVQLHAQTWPVSNRRRFQCVLLSS